MKTLDPIDLSAVDDWVKRIRLLDSVVESDAEGFRIREGEKQWKAEYNGVEGQGPTMREAMAALEDELTASLEEQKTFLDREAEALEKRRDQIDSVLGRPSSQTPEKEPSDASEEKPVTFTITRASHEACFEVFVDDDDRPIPRWPTTLRALAALLLKELLRRSRAALDALAEHGQQPDPATGEAPWFRDAADRLASWLGGCVGSCGIGVGFSWQLTDYGGFRLELDSRDLIALCAEKQAMNVTITAGRLASMQSVAASALTKFLSRDRAALELAWRVLGHHIPIDAVSGEDDGFQLSADETARLVAPRLFDWLMKRAQTPETEDGTLTFEVGEAELRARLKEECEK